jgi:putative restriction endonuclease
MENTTLQNYIDQFSHLHTDINHNRWTEATKFRAPHKPFLLLSILDLFSQGTISSNLIEVTPELGDLFAKYWVLIIGSQRRGNMALPFFHLRTSMFWHLIPVPGKEDLLKGPLQVDTLSHLQKLVIGASLDEDLYQLLQVEESRNLLRNALILTYFYPEHHTHLQNQGAINNQSFLYGQKLIEKARKQVKESATGGDAFQSVVRDQGFRKAVVRVYDHRCAFCGVRMLTVDGHSAVEAAHVIPWSISKNDDLKNGIALCKLCHWTFDEGLAGVSSKYTILLSSDLRTSLNFPGHLLTLQGRPILGPAETNLMPDPDFLDWHRQNKYRSS